MPCGLVFLGGVSFFFRGQELERRLKSGGAWQKSTKSRDITPGVNIDRALAWCEATWKHNRTHEYRRFTLRAFGRGGDGWLICTCIQVTGSAGDELRLAYKVWWRAAELLSHSF